MNHNVVLGIAPLLGLLAGLGHLLLSDPLNDTPAPADCYVVQGSSIDAVAGEISHELGSSLPSPRS